MVRICRKCGQPFDAGDTQKTVCHECRVRTNREAVRRYQAKLAEEAKSKDKKKSNTQQIRELANQAFRAGKTYGQYIAERMDDE